MTLTVSGATGQGRSDFGSAVLCTDISAQLIIPGFFVRFGNPGHSRSVHQVGWFGLGFLAGSDPDLITYGKWFQWEWEDLKIYNGTGAYADHFYWDLSPGTTCNFVAYT